MCKGFALKLSLSVAVCSLPITAMTQTANVAAATTVATSAVPRLITYSSVLKNSDGKTLTTITGVTFLLYKDEQGGAPLWLETQNVTPDKTGHYSVQLGTTSASGLPSDLFVSGEARWLAVQVVNDTEQARVLLVAVPYAMKAADAETIGGLPPSAFVLAAPPMGGNAASTTSSSPAVQASSSVPPPASSNVTTTGGTANTIPLFTTATNIQNSILTQTAKTAINVGGKLNLPATGTATALKGFNSQPQDFVASVFNSGTSTPVPQTFQWQAEPVGNNTSTASGSLNLLYATGTATPAETGLKINNKGLFTFAAGQTFPGTGTVTSVTAGAGLTGGTITHTGTIAIAAGGVSNADLAHSSIGVLAGADLTGGSAAIPLGGSTTLNLDTTKVPLLAAANTFTNNQSITGNLSVSGSVSAAFLNTTGVNTFSPGFSDFIGSEGVWIVEVENSGGGNGIISYNNATSGIDAGVYGAAPNSTTGVGVFGQQGSESAISSFFSGLGRGVGVWGDGGTTNGGTAIVGTTDNGNAGFFVNNNSSWDTVYIQANSANFPFDVFNNPNGTFCDIDSAADLTCSGAITGAVSIAGGARTVGLSAIASPENWFEDFGSAELVHGAAVVKLDADFMQTVNTDREYQVFLTPYGDCKGLYVTNRTPNSFEVHELGGGANSLNFGYRIAALRLKYEDVRFADHTSHAEKLKLMAKRTAPTPPHPHTPDFTRQPRPTSATTLLTPTAKKSQTR